MFNKFSLWSCFLALLLFGSSCRKEIDDDLSCGDEEVYYRVKVIDPITQQDITTSGEVERVGLFIFHKEEGYIQWNKLSKEDIINKVPIQVKRSSRDDILDIVAWGNLLGNKEVLVNLFPGNTADDISVSLLEDEEGFSRIPEDLFYGRIQIHPQSRKRYEEIVIQRINSRMHITVRGLPANKEDSDFVFKIDQQYSGYSFNGKPQPKNIAIRSQGIFNPDHDLVSSEPVHLIHCDETCSDPGVVLHIMDKEGNEIAKADKDSDGNIICPCAGKTTNIFIDLRETGSQMKVYMEVTPWNKVHQWNIW